MDKPNWRELPAGPELDRIVAERTGYSVQFFFERTDWHEDGWVLYKDGFHVTGDAYTDEQAVWDEELPLLSKDVNAALTLIDPEWEFSLILLGEKTHASINTIGPRLKDMGHGEALREESALAICRAVLDRADKQVA